MQLTYVYCKDHQGNNFKSTSSLSVALGYMLNVLCIEKIKHFLSVIPYQSEIYLFSLWSEKIFGEMVRWFH